MRKQTVYILHKNGAKSHYIGLRYLLEKHDIVLKYREFSVFGKMFKSAKKTDWKSFKKQWVNLFFLLFLLFRKDKKVVLGIAPFDKKLKRLLPVLKNHQIYYHTSWTCWDKSFHPKKNKSEKIFKVWKDFLEEKTNHIFCVSKTSKQSLLENYKIPSQKISMVFHSVNPLFFKKSAQSKIPKSFIYIGRMLPEKGIEELIGFFAAAENKALQLSLIGSGKLENLAEEAAKKNANISFTSHIADKDKLIELLGKHEFLLLNSKKTRKWEELFGMVLIEAMAQGVIPIAANHSGPKEIITEKTGILFTEGKVEEAILKALELPEATYKDLEKNAKEKAKNFSVKKIALNWQSILD